MGYLCFRRAQTNYFVETDVEQAHCFLLSLYVHIDYIHLLCVNLGGLCSGFFFLRRVGVVGFVFRSLAGDVYRSCMVNRIFASLFRRQNCWPPVIVICYLLRGLSRFPAISCE